MKKRTIIVLAAISVLLVGCNIKKTSSSSGSNLSSNVSSSSSANPDLSTIEIYATNDIHGQVKENASCPGVGKLGTFLKQRKAESNTLLFDQGDAWQGSVYSNHNHGKLITDVMNYVRYDARSIGNHDFDWGVDVIKENNQRSYGGYTTPVLAGNIYDFDFSTKVEGDTQQAEIGIKSLTINLDGLKIGVLGGIGRDQITSINSLFTRDIAFKDHVEFIKEEAQRLRNEENCNLIICSIHTGQESVTGEGLQKYVDLFLCGHTHKQEYSHEGSTYYVQAAGYEKSISHITIKYRKSTNSLLSTKVSYLDKTDISAKVQNIDPEIQTIINNYNVDSLANTVFASNVSGYFDRYEQSSNLMAKAIMDRTIAEGHSDVLFSMINEARDGLPYSTSWTFADIFECFPFDNIVYIATVKGRELQSQLNYNYICRNSSITNDEIDLNGDYKIAVLDYVYFHTNADRYYNYFWITGGTSNVTLSNNYRDILTDWMVDNHYNTGNVLNSNDYSFSQWNHNKSAFSFV